MRRIEYRYENRYPEIKGEWNDEPDKIQWTDEATALPCLIVRAPHHGALCGYVGVSDGHPYFAKPYNLIDDDISVHGGLTFSDFCQEVPHPGVGVCHLPEPGEPDKVWWFGFDCAHAFDHCPWMLAGVNLPSFIPRSARERDEVYRNVAYIEKEVRSLARQLKALTNQSVSPDTRSHMARTSSTSTKATTKRTSAKSGAAAGGRAKTATSRPKATGRGRKAAS